MEATKLFELEQPSETFIENCIVTANPIYKKSGSYEEWTCLLYAGADLFYPERDQLLQAFTRGKVKEAKALRLRSGDCIDITGSTQEREVETANGKKNIIFICVSHIQVLSRSQRISRTMYEIKNR